MESAAESLKSLNIFKKPMCLISNTVDGKLEIEEEPLKEIRKIDMPLVVVAISGLYRTGKSYLMNCMAGETQGFPLGDATKVKTKGIWAWCRNHPKANDQVLLLLDTVGFGDIAKGNTDNDNKIITIAALLCNVLVYNIMSAFSQDAVEKLTFISEMSKNVSFESGKSKKDDKFDLILPIFVLCLRDFILDIENNGKEKTTDEYLEDCLELKPGTGKDIDKYNRPRECIRRYFPKRKCFTFDRPGTKSVIKRLETASADELSDGFREKTEMFLNYVYSCKPKVLLSSKFVRGEMFATLATTYISAISNGAKPDVDDAIQMVAKMENERMSNAAVEEFKNKLETVELPVLNSQLFNKLYEDIQNASLAKFRSEAIFESEFFEKRAVDEMTKLWPLVREQNCEMIKHYCLTQLNQIYGETVGEKRESGKYFVPGGYEEYKEDIVKVKHRYREKMREIGEYEVTQSLNEFIEGEAKYENDVLEKDKKLSQEDRKREIENLKKENQEAQKNLQKLFEKKIAEEKQRTEEHYKKLELERKEYVKREEEKMQLLQKQWENQKKLSERQIQMMKTENEKQKQELKEEIQKLNEANSSREKENMERSDRLLAQEREFNKTQTDTMNQTFQDLIEKEQKKTEEYRNDMKKYQESVIGLQQKQEQERKQAEKKYEEERRRYDEYKCQQELELMRQIAEIKAAQEQGRIDAENARRERERIEAENRRLKDRNWWDRLWNN